MEVKEMRLKLKEVMDIVPQKNTDVIAKYNEKFGETELTESTTLKLVGKEMWTYIGSGDTPPALIKFMGIQVFSRGKLTEVTDQQVLAKIKGNKSFVNREVDPEELYDNDEKAKAIAEKQRDRDTELQIIIDRENRKAG